MKEQNTNSQNEKREHKKIPIFSSLKFKMVLMLIVATVVTAATLLLIMVPFSERQIKNETKKLYVRYCTEQLLHFRYYDVDR